MWLDADEAIERLGVKRSTLYTYASRGWIQTRREGRRRRYRAIDVEALRQRSQAHAGREAKAAGALAWGNPVLTTAISAHDVDGPYYRGVSALDLMETPLEQVAALLWQHEGSWPCISVPAVGDLLELAARVLPLTEPARIAATVRSAADLPDHPDLNAAFVLCADHGLNASTFAARVVAGTGAALGACVASGLAALSGVRHGTASLQIAAELHAPRTEGAEGFGHTFYPAGDPRGEALLARCPPTGALAARIERMAPQLPNLDVGLLAVCQRHGLPVHKAPLIFAVGRTVGWIAHAQEQDGLIRPTARYAW